MNSRIKKLKTETLEIAYLADEIQGRRTALLLHGEPMTSAIEAYEAFDKREPGWIKVKLDPSPKEKAA